MPGNEDPAGHVHDLGAVRSQVGADRRDTVAAHEDIGGQVAEALIHRDERRPLQHELAHHALLLRHLTAATSQPKTFMSIYDSN